MNTRGLRHYLDDLLNGRRPRGFRPDDDEAAQIRTAIDLNAARPGADTPREEFLTDLHSRIAAQMAGEPAAGAAAAKPPAAKPPAAGPRTAGPSASRRQVIVGTSAAAAAAAAAVAVDRTVFHANRADDAGTQASGELKPNDGSWQQVARSADVTADGVLHPFEVGSVIGFVRRVGTAPEAVSGICTHQGCKLWFDKPDDRLRCPCHSTSFAPDGQVLTHQLPISPAPLPTLQVRDNNGAIEVFAPTEPTEPA